MFIKVSDAATGKPVLLNATCVAKFEHSDEPGAPSFACLTTGERCRIAEPLNEIERRLYAAGVTDDKVPPVNVDALHNRLTEAIAAKAQADANEAARLRGEWPKSRI